MTRHAPPGLALKLLEWIGPDTDPVVGDLLEEFDRRPSLPWFLWQVLAILWNAWSERSDEIRPLRLVDLQPADAADRSRRMNLRFRPVNLTASPLPGIGGLGIVFLSLVVTAVVPAAWWLLLGSMLVGVVLGISMIVRRRAISDSGPPASGRSSPSPAGAVLFGSKQTG